MHCYTKYFKGHKNNRLRLMFARGDNEPRGLMTCSRLKMFTLNIRDVFQFALNFALFLYSLYSLYYFFLSFLSCAFVAKRNSSYQDGPPCHQH